MKLRTSEGRNGILSALILPYGDKTAVSLEIPIKALNLHARSQLNKDQLQYKPISKIEITGTFEVDEALAWLDDCLPDVPMSSTESKVVIGYKSAFLNTVLELRVKDKVI